MYLCIANRHNNTILCDEYDTTTSVWTIEKGDVCNVSKNTYDRNDIIYLLLQ